MNFLVLVRIPIFDRTSTTRLYTDAVYYSGRMLLNIPSLNFVNHMNMYCMYRYKKQYYLITTNNINNNVNPPLMNIQ